MSRTVSGAGRAALRGREGLRLEAYRDSVGVPTIGVGHTGRAAPPAVHMGMKITEAEADAILAADLAPFESTVNRAIVAVLTQNQFDACVSLAFNIGEKGFAGSTVVHKANAGDIKGAADAFLMWEKPKELASRREAERKQFLTPDDVHGPVAPHAAAPGTPAVGIAAEPKAPVLNGIIRAVNNAAGAASASHAIPPAQPTPAAAPSPATTVPNPQPSAWARFWAALTRKA